MATELFKNLDSWEQRILFALCDVGGHSPSSVALAADVYETTTDAMEWRTLQWWHIQGVLEHLNQIGLVRYRLGKIEHGAGVEIYIDIRVTTSGWMAIGRPIRRITIIGLNHHHGNPSDSPRPSDMTEFRNHQVTAHGDRIEVDTLDHHVVKYVDHAQLHQAQLEELEESSPMPRRNIPIADKQRAIELLHDGGSYKETEKATGISMDTLKRLVPPPPKTLTRHKASVLEQLATFDHAAEVHDFDARSMGLDITSLVRTLHELRKDGLVTFVEASTHSEGHHTTIKRIEITGKAVAQYDYLPKARGTAIFADPQKPPRLMESAATGNVIEYKEEGMVAAIRQIPATALETRSQRTAPPALPDPIKPRVGTWLVRSEPPPKKDWHQLKMLREKQERIAASEQIADKYVKAAQAVEDVDPEVSESLWNKALEVRSESLSPVEAEYLDYVKEHA